MPRISDQVQSFTNDMLSFGDDLMKGKVGDWTVNKKDRVVSYLKADDLSATGLWSRVINWLEGIYKLFIKGADQSEKALKLLVKGLQINGIEVTDIGNNQLTRLFNALVIKPQEAVVQVREQIAVIEKHKPIIVYLNTLKKSELYKFNNEYQEGIPELINILFSPTQINKTNFHAQLRILERLYESDFLKGNVKEEINAELKKMIEVLKTRQKSKMFIDDLLEPKGISISFGKKEENIPESVWNVDESGLEYKEDLKEYMNALSRDEKETLWFRGLNQLKINKTEIPSKKEEQITFLARNCSSLKNNDDRKWYFICKTLIEQSREGITFGVKK